MSQAAGRYDVMATESESVTMKMEVDPPKADLSPPREEETDVESPPTPPPDDMAGSDPDPVVVDSSSEGGRETPEPKDKANNNSMKQGDTAGLLLGGKKGRRGIPGPKPNRNRAPPPLHTLSAIRGPPLSSAAARKIMWDQYQPWVMSTYGDAAKTKTITTKKYGRIVALLRTLGGSTGLPTLNKDGTAALNVNEPMAPVGSSSEAAKFKLWVKSKGFHLGPPPGHPDHGLPHTVDMLYLPTGTDKVGGTLDFFFSPEKQCCQLYFFLINISTFRNRN